MYPLYEGYGEGYDVAQICLNGHLINDCARTKPEHNEKCCAKCGAETITACQNCNHYLRGFFHSDGFISIDQDTLPQFCYNCGEPYVWTKRMLAAAHDLVHEATSLDEHEKELLTQSLDDLIRETPATEGAILRVKRLLPKAGNAIGKAVKDVMVSVLTEVVKDKLWPGG